MLHRVRPAPDDPFRPNGHLEVTPDFLDRALARVRATGARFVSLEEAADRARRGFTDERFVATTLDDGYRDNLVHALPVFRRHGVPHTVFVATGMVEGTASAWWLTLEAVVRAAPRIEAVLDGRPLSLDTRAPAAKARGFDRIARRVDVMAEDDRAAFVRALATAHGLAVPRILSAEMMTWDDVRAIAADPLATIGGHTVDHPALATLPVDRARREIGLGLDRLETELGVRPRQFAYPFGNVRAAGRREAALMAEFGIDVAVTTRGGLIGPREAGDTLFWPRVSLNGDHQTDAVVDLLVSGAPFRLARAAGAVRRLIPTGRRGTSAPDHTPDPAAGGAAPV
nr:polysaccharide deacetylase family protein [Chthonobacter rhizosphaerae]